MSSPTLMLAEGNDTREKREMNMMNSVFSSLSFRKFTVIHFLTTVMQFSSMVMAVSNPVGSLIENERCIPSKNLKHEARSQYCCWWLQHLATPTNDPELCTYRLFKTSFATSPYLNTGPHYLRPALLHFRCSNHRLDIELGQHLNVPRDERYYRFCRKPKLGDKYPAFQCEAFMDLQVLCGVNVTSFPQFIQCMQTLEINVQRYISLI